VQTHLFEDRVMKCRRSTSGRAARSGADAVVLYDSRMEPGAALGEMSLLMKGESLPTARVGRAVRPGRPPCRCGGNRRGGPERMLHKSPVPLKRREGEKGDEQHRFFCCPLPTANCQP